MKEQLYRSYYVDKKCRVINSFRTRADSQADYNQWSMTIINVYSLLLVFSIGVNYIVLTRVRVGKITCTQYSSTKLLAANEDLEKPHYFYETSILRFKDQFDLNHILPWKLRLIELELWELCRWHNGPYLKLTLARVGRHF